jgi:hypothetical protein
VNNKVSPISLMKKKLAADKSLQDKRALFPSAQ